MPLVVAVDDKKELLLGASPHHPFCCGTASCCLGLIAGVLDLKVRGKDKVREICGCKVEVRGMCTRSCEWLGKLPTSHDVYNLFLSNANIKV